MAELITEADPRHVHQGRMINGHLGYAELLLR